MEVKSDLDFNETIQRTSDYQDYYYTIGRVISALIYLKEIWADGCKSSFIFLSFHCQERWPFLCRCPLPHYACPDRKTRNWQKSLKHFEVAVTFLALFLKDLRWGWTDYFEQNFESLEWRHLGCQRGRVQVRFEASEWRRHTLDWPDHYPQPVRQHRPRIQRLDNVFRINKTVSRSHWWLCYWGLGKKVYM